MSGDSILIIPIIFSIFDHEAGMVGNLEPLHTSDQLRPETYNAERFTRPLVGEKRDFTYDFPENMGPRISCSG